MAEGLAEPQWLNLAKKTNESYYGQNNLLHDVRQPRDRRRDRYGGIGRRYFFAYPNLSCFLAIAQRRIALLCVRPLASDLVTAPSMQDVEPRRLPSVAFTPSGPLVYQWQKNRSEALPSLTIQI